VEILNAVFGIGFSSESPLVFEGWLGWIIWAMILSVIGTRHPPTMDDYVSLDAKRKFVGFIALLVFIGCFTPVPIQI
jgi:membrane-associated protease RseP (regulator of RpoE activity)